MILNKCKFSAERMLIFPTHWMVGGMLLIWVSACASMGMAATSVDLTNPHGVVTNEGIAQPAVTISDTPVANHLADQGGRTETLSNHLSSPTVEFSTPVPSDRFWLISTRHLRGNACSARLDDPSLRVSQFDCRGRCSNSDLEHLLEPTSDGRTTVIYVHGNRMESSSDAIRRSLAIYQTTKTRCAPTRRSIDWIVWSWPSEKEGILLHDVRVKAARADTQGLYLAWFLREHMTRGQPTAMIGYSFGARVVTGALHALAGGKLGGRALPGDYVQGANVDIGLVAPAIDSHWLATGGYHQHATKNLDSVRLLYNRRDVVLKNYWRLDRIRNADALGYSGPKRFAPRIDGTRLPVIARDCAAVVGRHHSELDYYTSRCRGGIMMSQMIAQSCSEGP